MFGSGEGPVWATGRGYSTSLDLARTVILDGLQTETDSAVEQDDVEAEVTVSCSEGRSFEDFGAEKSVRGRTGGVKSMT